MGSITFDSQDGSSRVHDHVLNDIRIVKRLFPEDDDVILSLTAGFFQDFTWIAGEDRAYFAERLRSVLTCDPPGEWSHRGLSEFDETNEDVCSDDAEFRRRRFAGIHSVISHLEANQEFPVVIYHSVSASFPTTEFAPSDWKETHGEDAQGLLDALSHADCWKLIWPTFLGFHESKRWENGITNYATKVKEQLKSVGFWRDASDANVFEDRLFKCKTLKGLSEEIKVELVGFAQSCIADMPRDAHLYVIGEGSTARLFAEPFARSIGERLAGYANVGMRMAFGPTKGLGRVYTYSNSQYFEDASVNNFIAVLCVPVFASADVIIDTINSALPVIGDNPVFIVTGIANSQQVDIALSDFQQRQMTVFIRSVHCVDYDLVGAWRHTTELAYEDGLHYSNPSSWMFKRMIEGMKSKSLK